MFLNLEVRCREKQQHVSIWPLSTISRETPLGVIGESQPVSCQSGARGGEGGGRSLSHFVSQADTNRVAGHVTDRLPHCAGAC